MPIREVVEPGCRLTLDTSRQVVHWDVAGDPLPFQLAQSLMPSVVKAQSAGFVSTGVLLAKAKQFDDGLYAAIELLAQNGGGNFAGKRHLLSGLVAALSSAAASAPTLGALENLLVACRLGEVPIACPPAFEQSVDLFTQRFHANELLSKPISFYTWSHELSAIFRQDRALQSLLDPDVAMVIIEQLRNDTLLKNAYTNLLDMTSRLTSRFAEGSLAPYLFDPSRTIPAQPVSFLPASLSPETELAKKIFGTKEIPEGFSLIEEVITRLRQGTMTLQPGVNSGWYDYSLWAREPLALYDKVQESSRRLVGQKYADQLLDLFRGAYCSTRETHVKQLESCVLTGPPPFAMAMHVAPECTVEPHPSVYFRIAVAYRFVQNALESVFGTGPLEKSHRLREDGPVSMPLMDELRMMQELFSGAHLVACAELGMEPFEHADLSNLRKETSSQTFLQWAKDPASDIDLSRDMRCMVPLFYDRTRRMTKVWLFLGWRQVSLSATYKIPPDIVGLDVPASHGPAEPQLQLASGTVQAAYPATAEAYVSSPMNRDEFRLLCDQFVKEQAIVDAVQQRNGTGLR